MRTELQEQISAIARSWHIRDLEKKQEVDLKASVIQSLPYIYKVQNQGRICIPDSQAYLLALTMYCFSSQLGWTEVLLPN